MTSLTSSKAPAKPETWVDLVKTGLLALLAAIFIRTVLVQPFRIPSGSMQPTLLVGDYIMVIKGSYGYSRFSPPLFEFGPHGRVMLPLLSHKPERGDVVVFRPPHDIKTDYVKRLIGLPGDRVQMRDGALFINGEAVERELIGAQSFKDWDQAFPNSKFEGVLGEVRAYRETLPNGVNYVTFDRFDSDLDNTAEFVVPQGHYFMMGDDRDKSDDSRLHVGMVPFENFVGKAQFVFISFEPSSSLFRPWTLFTDFRPSRTFKGLE